MSGFVQAPICCNGWRAWGWTGMGHTTAVKTTRQGHSWRGGVVVEARRACRPSGVVGHVPFGIVGVSFCGGEVKEAGARQMIAVVVSRCRQEGGVGFGYTEPHLSQLQT